MAELNLVFVAKHIIGLLGSEGIMEEGSLRGVPQKVLEELEKEFIPKVATLLLDAEKKADKRSQLKDWLMRVGEELYDAENLLEDFCTAAERHRLMSSQYKKARVLIKQVLRFLSTLNHVTSRSKPLIEIQKIKRVLDSLASRGNGFLLEQHRDLQKQENDLQEVGAIIPTSPFQNNEGTVEPCRLEALSPEKSWTLFQIMAFRHGSQETDMSDTRWSIGKLIVRWCRGHPLLISAIGSMLSFENTPEKWQRFYENEFSRTVQEYCDVLLDVPTNLPPGFVFQLLKLCYAHLPWPLKHCFAYSSLFPKDHEIDVQKLLKLWMAQGLINPHTSEHSLKNVGYWYFENLLRRSFFYEVAKDARGHVAKCKMADLMHDLATYVAGERCFVFSSSDIEMIDRRPSHVSFGFGLFSAEDIPTSLVRDGRNLRSILLPTQLRREDRASPDDTICVTMSSRFRLLRVLDMHALGIKIVPGSIDKLKHLKYLDLSENEDIPKLPNSITKLFNLQTLRLSSCFKLKKFPRDIGQLVNLRHLENDGCYSLTGLPKGFGKMTKLQTLSQVILSEDTNKCAEELSELAKLTDLREEIKIKNLGHGIDDSVATCLQAMGKVRSVSFEWGSRAPESSKKPNELENIQSNLSLAIEELTLNGFGGKTLFFSFPSNLVKISFRRFTKCMDLPSFGQCLKLKVLVLDEMTDLEFVENECKVTAPKTFFPSLQELWLTELPNLQGWWRSISLESQDLPSFPCLSKLVIEDCPKLALLPLFPTLEGLVLDSTCWSSFQFTMKQKLPTAIDKASSSSSSSTIQSSPFSKLKNLCIVGIDKFGDSKAKKIAWGNLTSLKVLKFDSLPELETLPEALQHVTSLRELHIWRCGVKEIPNWIDKLTSLEKLVIRVCPNIKLLPKGIRGLKLKTLDIEDCPTLIRRCEKEIGADWKKVKAILDLRLGT